jgi:hypothetical protein
MKQKGQVEDHWTALKFDSFTILRPGLLGRGNDMKTVEKMFAYIQTPIPCEIVGRAIAHRCVVTNLTATKEEKPTIWENPQIYAEAEKKFEAGLNSDVTEVKL